MVQLDSITRRKRCGLPEDEGGQNFEETCPFEELLRLCAEKQDAIVVGFEGGAAKLRQTSIDELKRRASYKWDHTQHGKGIKDDRNWIPGAKFLRIAGSLSRTVENNIHSCCVPAHPDRASKLELEHCDRTKRA